MPTRRFQYPKPPTGYAGLEGIVSDERTSKPLAGASILIGPAGLRLTSDALGRFSVAIPIIGKFQAVSETVSAAGYGLWERIDQRLYADRSYSVDVLLGPKPVRSVYVPPLAETGPRKQATREASSGFKMAKPLEYVPVVYSDQWLTPPTIRVEIISAAEKSGCDFIGALPPTVDHTTTYSMDFYIKHVLVPEIGGEGYVSEAIKANALAVKNYGWYFVNGGGKWYSTTGDVDDTTNFQCFDPNANVPREIADAADAVVGLVIHDDGVVYQTQYYGRDALTCSDSNGTYMWQNGSNQWATAGACSRQLNYDGIIHHYYYTSTDPTLDKMTIDYVGTPVAPNATWKRTNESPVTLHFESKGTWQYVVWKYAGFNWFVLANIYQPNIGSIPTEYVDSSVLQGSTYTYAIATKGSGGWSAYTYVDIPAWTTDLWNPSFENPDVGGNKAWFWSGLNNPTTGTASGWSGAYSLRFSSPAGVWSSVYQDLAFSSGTVCPNLVAHIPAGYPGNLLMSLYVYQLPSQREFHGSWLLPLADTWYRIPLSGGDCQTFSAPDSSLRIIVRIDQGGTVDIDATRLVYDPDTYWRY